MDNENLNKSSVGENANKNASKNSTSAPQKPIAAKPAPTSSSNKTLPKAPISPKAPSKSNINPASPSGAMPKAPETKSTAQNLNRPVVKPIDVDTKNNQNLPKQQNKDEKDKKKKRRWLLLLLLLLLLFLIIGGVVALVLSTNNQELNITISIDSEIDTGEQPEPITTKYVPGDILPVYLKFKISTDNLINSNPKLYVRYKISAFVDDIYVSGLFDPVPIHGNEQEAIKGADNYFYYKKAVPVSDTYILAFENLNFTPEYANNILNGKTVKISITLEVIEANMTAVNNTVEWQSAPNEWRNIVR